MDDVAPVISATNVCAILEGGPPDLPETSRIQVVSPFAQKIKVSYYGGYEHFERICPLEEDARSQQVVFRWTMRTELAE